MEIHWGAGCQFYVTPVSPHEICVALISRDPHLRLAHALEGFPELRQRLARAPATSMERGGVSTTRRLRGVSRGKVALIGDASGSVDAITGEGLCLTFQQAIALADALAAGDLSLYESAHPRIQRRAAFMADFMLLMDRSRWLRARALKGLARRPKLFENLLAMHVGRLGPRRIANTGMSLGWEVVRG